MPYKHTYVCAQLRPILCHPLDYSLSGSSIHGIFQARILDWVAISYSPGDLLDPGIEPMSLASPALAGRFFTTVPPYIYIYIYIWRKKVLMKSCFT